MMFSISFIKKAIKLYVELDIKISIVLLKDLLAYSIMEHVNFLNFIFKCFTNSHALN